jgi:AAA+ superfamily predicted ATPase
MSKKTRNIKRKKHDQIVNDYDKIKSKHLERLANKILKDEEKRDNLRLKHIKGNFLDKF